jgi:hypothetical protein
LREETSIVLWATLFIKVVGKQAPPESMSEDTEDREAHPWWKAKKWAYSNLNRLFVRHVFGILRHYNEFNLLTFLDFSRYGNPQSIAANGSENYEKFSKHFIQHFAPEILKAYLQQIDLWVSKQAWLSKICLSCTIAFMDEWYIALPGFWFNFGDKLTILQHKTFSNLEASESAC